MCDSVSRFKFGTVLANVMGQQSTQYTLDVGGVPIVTFANAMSVSNSVRAQAKVDENSNKLVVIVFNSGSSQWNGSVCWFAVI